MNYTGRAAFAALLFLFGLCEKFFQAVDVLLQGDFCVGVTAMIQNSYRPFVTGTANNPEKVLVVLPLAKRQDFWFCAVVHAIEV